MHTRFQSLPFARNVIYFDVHPSYVPQAKPYVTNEDTFDLNALLSALFLGVLILILFFVVSLILLLK